MSVRNPIWSPGGLLILAATVVLVACDDPVEPRPDDEPDPEPRPAVLHVTHISRSPRIPPPGPDDPPDAGWPVAGEDVRWVAHLFNSGETDAPAVPYGWTVDGDNVLHGEVDVPAGGGATVELRRAWPDGRERVGLSIHPPPSEADDGQDHHLDVASDALSLGLWIDREIAEYMVFRDGILPFPAWAGHEVRAWDAILERYDGNDGFDEPPEILDRIRLDRVVVLPEESTWPSDIDTDLAWFFTPRNTIGLFITVGRPPEHFEDQTVVLHELLHQRGISDLYAYRVFHDSPNGSEVRIREPDGSLAAGGTRMPFVGQGILYNSPYQPYLMGARLSHGTVVSPHTAYGLNHVAGRRTPRWIDASGNALNGFEAGAVGGNDYLLDVPDSVRLRIRIGDAAAPEGTEVEAFFDHAAMTYQNLHGPEPDGAAAVGGEGTATLSVEALRSPSDPGGLIDTDVVILRVTEGSRWGYAFLPVYELNRAWAEGVRRVAELRVDVEVR
ncbi:MAG: hypothetical protein PVI57_21370 [Gemmatimonadota bacterium]|jgi:hypothetical protein